VRQAFLNMQRVAQSGGARLSDAVRLVVYVTDMARHRPLVNQAQGEVWGQGPYPPRTIAAGSALNQHDIAAGEGTVYAPLKCTGSGRKEDTMLELRPGCECCNKYLPPDAADAMICTFECTFCRNCVENRLGGRCPNCGGNFAPRPVRPAAKLAK